MTKKVTSARNRSFKSWGARARWLLVMLQLVLASPSAAETVDLGDEVKIVVHVDGEGPDVVLLPSLGRGAADFDDLTARLVANGFRVLRPEPRGVGGSMGPTNDIALDDLADDVAGVIDRLADGPVDIIGHAFGQRVARMVATRHPARVRRLVLLAAGGRVAMSAEAWAAVNASFDRALRDEDRLRAIAFAFFSRGRGAEAWLHGWYPEVARYQANASDRGGKDWWFAGTATVLIIQPLDDILAVPENATLLMRDAGTRAKRVDIPDAGHALLPEQPEAVATAIMEFLARQP